MSDFREVIEAEIASARNDMQQATARYETWTAVLAKYNLAHPSKNGTQVAAIHDAAKAPGTGEDDDDETNKTQLVLDAVVKAHQTGVRPATVYSALRGHGVMISRNYVYSVLGRLEKRGKVQHKSKRWYATISALSGSATAKEGESKNA